MIEQNVEFQEKYKQLDAICKDMFSSRDGVTQYIYEMEKTDWQYRRFVLDWDDTYKQLKHMRCLRNQLAHETGTFDSDLCTEYDIEWLTDFYNSILHTTDPLAMVGKAVRAAKERKTREKIQTTTYTFNENKKQKISLWDRIKLKIKQWFS